MEYGSSLCRNSEPRREKQTAGAANGLKKVVQADDSPAFATRARTSGRDGGVEADGVSGEIRLAAHLERISEGVRASAMCKRGEYDARRLRSQREIIRDVMLSAADCDTWLTLGELRALTRYGEASISAQLRHLRKLENGGYDVAKRHREDAAPSRSGTDGRGECVWEYRVARADVRDVPANAHG
jgi:hypothetical protein